MMDNPDGGHDAHCISGIAIGGLPGFTAELLSGCAPTFDNERDARLASPWFARLRQRRTPLSKGPQQ